MERISLVVRPKKEQAEFYKQCMAEVDKAYDSLLKDMDNGLALHSALQQADKGVNCNYFKLALPASIHSDIVKKNRGRNMPGKTEQREPVSRLEFACNRGDKPFEVIGKVYIKFIREYDEEKVRTGVAKKIKQTDNIDDITLTEGEKGEWLLEFTSYTDEDPVDTNKRRFN